MREELVRVVFSGDKSAFWDDVWIGATPLKVIFNRLYMLSHDQGGGLINLVLGRVKSGSES